MRVETVTTIDYISCYHPMVCSVVSGLLIYFQITRRNRELPKLSVTKSLKAHEGHGPLQCQL